MRVDAQDFETLITEDGEQLGGLGPGGPSSSDDGVQSLQWVFVASSRPQCADGLPVFAGTLCRPRP